jgi:N-acylglucosamine-6-phosphate 2-epimerase
MTSSILAQLQSQLIVSVQAPKDSPIHAPEVITAIAKAAVKGGAKGLRLDTPEHVEACRRALPEIPIIGLWKREYPGYAVYITPCQKDALAIVEAGADIIAIDATLRERPNGETVAELISQIHKWGKLVMADIDSLESALTASQAGANIIGTTLYGYTAETQNCPPPGYDLLAQCLEKIEIPVICEGGIATPAMAKKALDLGAYSIVVGTAITGIDLKVQAFQAVMSN